MRAFLTKIMDCLNSRFTAYSGYAALIEQIDDLEDALADLNAQMASDLRLHVVMSDRIVLLKHRLEELSHAFDTSK